MRTAFCFDLDGTVTTREILPCIASELDITEEIATLTDLTMRGLISFEHSLRLRALILGQVPVGRVHKVIDEIPLHPRITRFLRERPSQCFVVTGNLDVWIGPLAARLGCPCFSSKARDVDGRLRIDHVLDKGDAVRELRRSGSFDRIVAVGDGANDVAMLESADVGIAFGGVHSPMLPAILAADYVVHSGDSLCSLLKAL
jgi:HAD superfamily phosphoserine phosphatase-like hydrolase